MRRKRHNWKGECVFAPVGGAGKNNETQKPAFQLTLSRWKNKPEDTSVRILSMANTFWSILVPVKRENVNLSTWKFQGILCACVCVSEPKPLTTTTTSSPITSKDRKHRFFNLFFHFSLSLSLFYTQPFLLPLNACSAVWSSYLTSRSDNAVWRSDSTVVLLNRTLVMVVFCISVNTITRTQHQEIKKLFQNCPTGNEWNANRTKFRQRCRFISTERHAKQNFFPSFSFE